MALTTLQKDAILSNLPSVFANEEGRIKLAEYIIAGEISWEEIEEMGSLSASQIEELRWIVNSKEENSFWAYVSQEDSIEAYQQYLDQYPTGKYANIAKICMESCQTASPIRPAKNGDRRNLTLKNCGTTYIPECSPCEQDVRLARNRAIIETLRENTLYLLGEYETTPTRHTRSFLGGIGTLLKNIFHRSKTNKSDNTTPSKVYSSTFAPAEVKRGAHLLAQVYLHLYDETEQVKAHAQMADKNAEQRGYIPLSLNLKKGDNVDIEFHVDGETRLMSERKSITWRGSFTKCTFKYHVPKDIDIEELSCEANLFVNGALIGEMTFLTQIVESPENLNTCIQSRRFNKIFISYSHKDTKHVQYMAEAYKAQGVEYFYDRHNLNPGDVYEEIIYQYIDSSDLFILCWSKNTAESKWVPKEINRALLRVYPHVSQEEESLRIYPISLKPYADLPKNITTVHNYGKI